MSNSPTLQHRFQPFANRDFRLLWSVDFLRSGAYWIDQVVRPVLMFDLTESPLLLGATFAVWVAASLLVAPFVGLILDRFERRLVLFWTLVAHFLGILLLLVPLSLGALEVWQVFASAAISGVAIEFVETARRAMLPDVLPGPQLLSGTGLLQTARTTTQIAGALTAGLLLATADAGLTYALAATLYLVAAMGLTRLRTNQRPREADPSRRSPWSELTAGLRWATAARWPLAVLGLLLIAFLLISPYQGVFLPLMAIDVLMAEPAWVGYLVAVRGLGGTIGSLGLASVREIRSPGAMLIGLFALGGCALMAIGAAPHLAILALGVFVASIVDTNILSVSNLTFLTHTPDVMRGRALSLSSIASGIGSAGALLAGLAAEALGVREALFLLAGCVGVSAVGAWFLLRLRWWLWRRSAFNDAAAEAWLRARDNDR